jgi:hypothetical protein
MAKRIPYTYIWAGIAITVLTIMVVILAVFLWFARKRDVIVVRETPIMQQAEDRQPPIYPVKGPTYPTSRDPSTFQQVGVLVADSEVDKKPTILPLFGKKLATHRDRWEYYTASDEYHMWRVPVSVQKRMCDEEVGCEEIYNGDEVVVPDYGNRGFRARIYKYTTNTH